MGILLEWGCWWNGHQAWNGHHARYNSQNDKAKYKGESFGGALRGYWL